MKTMFPKKLSSNNNILSSPTAGIGGFNGGASSTSLILNPGGAQ